MTKVHEGIRFTLHCQEEDREDCDVMILSVTLLLFVQ